MISQQPLVLIVNQSHPDTGNLEFELRDPTSPSLPVVSEIRISDPTHQDIPSTRSARAKPPEFSFVDHLDSTHCFCLSRSEIRVINLENSEVQTSCDGVLPDTTQSRFHGTRVQAFWKGVSAGVPSRPMIAAFGVDLTLWDAMDGELIETTNSSSGYAFFDIVSIPWRQWVAFGGYDNFEVYDSCTLDLVQEIGPHDGNMLAFGANCINKTLVCTGDEGTTFWDLSSEVRNLRRCDFEGRKVVLDPDNHLILLESDHERGLSLFDERFMDQCVASVTNREFCGVDFIWNAGGGLCFGTGSTILWSLRFSDLKILAEARIDQSNAVDGEKEKSWGPGCAIPPESCLLASESCLEEWERIDFVDNHVERVWIRVSVDGRAYRCFSSFLLILRD